MSLTGLDGGDIYLFVCGAKRCGCPIRGNEFVVMLPDLGADLAIATDHASSIAEKIRAALAQAYLLERTGKAGA
ncbi:hypothetical protein [Alishewanella longhuensis]